MNRDLVLRRISGLDNATLSIIESNFDIVGLEENLLVTALKEDNTRRCTTGILNLIELCIAQILEEKIPACKDDKSKEKLYEMITSLVNSHARIKSVTSDKDKIREFNQFVINEAVPGLLRFFVNQMNIDVFSDEEALEHYNNDYSILPKVPSLIEVISGEYYKNRNDKDTETACKECACDCQCSSKKEEITVQEDIKALKEVLDDLAELSSKIGNIGSRLIDKINKLNVK